MYINLLAKTWQCSIRLDTKIRWFPLNLMCLCETWTVMKSINTHCDALNVWSLYNVWEQLMLDILMLKSRRPQIAVLMVSYDCLAVLPTAFWMKIIIGHLQEICMQTTVLIHVTFLLKEHLEQLLRQHFCNTNYMQLKQIWCLWMLAFYLTWRRQLSRRSDNQLQTWQCSRRVCR